MYVVISLSKRNIIIVLVVILVSLGLGSLGGFFTYDFLRTDIIDGVYVDELSLAKLDKEAVVHKLQEYLGPRLEEQVTIHFTENALSFKVAELGFGYDYETMAEEAHAIGRRGNWFHQRVTRQKILEQGLRLRPKVTLAEEQYQRFLQSLRKQVETAPVSARWEVSPRTREVKLIPAVDGITVDGNELKRLVTALLTTSPPYELVLPLERVRARVDTEEAANLGIHEVVASYRTYFNPNNTGRVKNILLAAKAIDEKIILPGETFSFNKSVGPRIPESGYEEAPIIVNGELVPGIGGGVCQVSTTLYNAAVLADLTVLERNRHSLPSAYVGLGRDATVFYDYLDLKLHNETPNPVLVDTIVGQNYLDVLILGQWSNNWRVKIQVEDLAEIPPKWEEEYDPALAPGERVIVKEGHPGWRGRVWKQYVDGRGAIINQELLSVDTYQPINGLVKVGRTTNSATN